MRFRIGILAIIVFIVSPFAVMAQVDPSSSFTSSSSAICDGSGSAFIFVRANVYWTMTVYREYVATNISGGSYALGPTILTDVIWTGGTFALDSNNRWSEWDKMWIGTDASGELVTQHFIEFDCTGKSAGENADVYICNDFAGNDPYICLIQPSPSPISISTNGGFADGRINAYDAGAPVVVYPWNDETGVGLALYNAQGAALLFVSAAELSECPSENTLVAADESAQVWVYHLSSCGYQIHARQPNGKMYILSFTTIGRSTAYSSQEVE